MTSSVIAYQSLITSEHSDKPNYMAMIAATMQPLVDIQNVLLSLPSEFDIDNATGNRLDIDGQWVGVNRNLSTSNPGYHVQPDPSVVPLSDTDYQTAIKAKAKSNHWDGTAQSAFDFSVDFLGQGTFLSVVDFQNMSMQINISGKAITPGLQAVLAGGFLELRPCGVLASYNVPTEPGGPLFGFDSENSYISGFDVGVWAQEIG